MHQLMRILLIPAYLCICGFTSPQNQPDQFYLDKIKDHTPSIVVVHATYPETFKATINVFRDLNINILKKDLSGKMILGTHIIQGVLVACSYGVFFTNEDSGEIKVSVKVHGNWFDGDYVVNKIKDEVELQKKLEQAKIVKYSVSYNVGSTILHFLNL